MRIATLFPVIVILIFGVISGSCTSPRHLGRTAIPGRFLDDPAISDTHVGIAIYDAGKGEYVYTHNSDKFFVPASNTKIPTLYAGLKYLDEGVPGIRYYGRNDTVFLLATGDPTFLAADFPEQPVFDFMKRSSAPLVFIEPHWNTGALGYGWPWNFYLNYYMPERSPFPVYGNVVVWAQREMKGLEEGVRITYASSYPRHHWPVALKESDTDRFRIHRPVSVNDYLVHLGLEGDRELFVPFSTGGMKSAIELLSDTLGVEIGLVPARKELFEPLLLPGRSADILKSPAVVSGDGQDTLLRSPAIKQVPGHFTTIISRPADSLFRTMMLYSDNFFAEQTLLMVSQKLFGVMDEERLIRYLLENDLADIPDVPRWVDGSGLSRYNIFSPRSFVWLLEKMNDEFGYERMSRLLPAGGEGTLGSHYLDESEKIYAKTGTLSGNAVALSGYITTSSGRNLIFSVLVNNHNKVSAEVRDATESFLKEIINRY